MNLGTLIATVLDLVAKVRVASTFSDYKALFLTILDILKQITTSLDAPLPGPVLMADVTCGPPQLEGNEPPTLKGADVCCELEELCKAHAPRGAGDTQATGPFVQLLLPLLTKLLLSLLTK